MKKILFPTDFSSQATNAFNYVVEMAKVLRAQIDVIHIYSVSFSDSNPMPVDLMQQMMDQKLDTVNQDLRNLVKGRRPDLIGKTKAIYGIFPATEIAEFAKNGQYDYIVMGTKGATNKLDNLMGSITTRVMLRSTQPVIAVPSGAVFKPLEHIVYATALVPNDVHMVEQLMEFAGQQKAMVHFVHVNTKLNTGIENIDMAPRHLPVEFSDFTIINNYSVSKGLTEYIESNGMDMLALYIPNRRLLERLFHTSLSKKMALHSKIPLIVFHQ